ncbi:alpha-N-arabinofuranosidase [Blastococcus litoris]|uniref:arabinosylfuranosidase ArfA n=1 Tax=Blastococcus litoris TaxID=2171622 RepID=UPI000E305033|nr:alpha-N-arabinofuranosidase [Blastococcus litoris]
MLRAGISIDPAFTVAPVNRRTFGSFVEHMGRCVYTGIHEPEHPTADEDGFRQDVLELVRELGVSVVRYPGGNFVSGYRWEDGVGPVSGRPRRLDPAWRSLEPNTFGLDEFVRWSRKAGVEPMMAVNLGTRGLQEAIDLLEYCNHPGGTALSDLRRRHGAEQPYGIGTWCLGNEMDGPWQLGHKPAAEYGRIAAETASAMRQFDAGLQLVACGSSYRHMPTFGAWEAEVLERAYDSVDAISAHAYYEDTGDTASFLASAVDMDAQIRDVVATADHVRAKLGRSKRIDVSFDEWNVWYVSRLSQQVPEEWTFAPRISEDAYTVTDAVVVGSMLITLLRHSDRVTAACQAQLVNTISSIRAEPGGPAWRQTIFHPFAQAARLARGQVLQVVVDSPTYGTEKYGEVPVVDAVATHDEDTGELAVLCVNRSQTEAVELALDLRAFPGVRLAEATVLADEDRLAANTAEAPERVRPRGHPDAVCDGERLRVVLPPVSWNAVRLAPTG